jgi:hypothetical protein
MWKIVTTAISAFLLLSNTVSAQGYVSPQDYVPREFWNDSAEVKRVLDMAVTQSEKWYQEDCSLYECAEDEDTDEAERIAKNTYPHMELYMQEKNLPAPTLEEFMTSIGIQYIPLNFDELSDDARIAILKATYIPDDVLDANAYTFLDYVGGLLGRELY